MPYILLLLVCVTFAATQCQEAESNRERREARREMRRAYLEALTQEPATEEPPTDD